jgi:hypothetical protein
MESVKDELDLWSVLLEIFDQFCSYISESEDAFIQVTPYNLLDFKSKVCFLTNFARIFTTIDRGRVFKCDDENSGVPKGTCASGIVSLAYKVSELLLNFVEIRINILFTNENYSNVIKEFLKINEFLDMDLLYTVLDRLGTSKRQVYINGLKSIPIYKELLEHCNSNVELIKLDPSFDLEDHTLFISPKCDTETSNPGKIDDLILGFDCLKLDNEINNETGHGSSSNLQLVNDNEVEATKDSSSNLLLVNDIEVINDTNNETTKDSSSNLQLINDNVVIDATNNETTHDSSSNLLSNVQPTADDVEHSTSAPKNTVTQSDIFAMFDMMLKQIQSQTNSQITHMSELFTTAIRDVSRNVPNNSNHSCDEKLIQTLVDSNISTNLHKYDLAPELKFDGSSSKLVYFIRHLVTKAFPDVTRKIDRLMVLQRNVTPDMIKLVDTFMQINVDNETAIFDFLNYLVNQYGDRNVLSLQTVNDFLASIIFDHNNKLECERFKNELVIFYKLMNFLGAITYINNCWFLSDFLNKIPNYVRLKWDKYVSKHDVHVRRIFSIKNNCSMFYNIKPEPAEHLKLCDDNADSVENDIVCPPEYGSTEHNIPFKFTTFIEWFENYYIKCGKYINCEPMVCDSFPAHPVKNVYFQDSGHNYENDKQFSDENLSKKKDFRGSGKSSKRKVQHTNFKRDIDLFRNENAKFQNPKDILHPSGSTTTILTLDHIPIVPVPYFVSTFRTFCNVILSDLNRSFEMRTILLFDTGSGMSILDDGIRAMTKIPSKKTENEFSRYKL